MKEINNLNALGKEEVHHMFKKIIDDFSIEQIKTLDEMLRGYLSG